MSFTKLWDKFSRPGYLCAIATCLLVAFFPGCTQARSAPEPVTISFVHPEVDQEHYEPLAQQFNERYPHITVELRPKEWRQLGNLNDEDADVYWVSQGLFVQLWEAGKVLDLDSFIENDNAFESTDFYPGVLDVLTREGKTWAVPSGADVVVMYYNQDLFDQYNVPYPEIGWTWSDFLERAVALRDPDADYFGYGPRTDMLDAVFFVYQHGGRIFDDLKVPKRTTFDELLTIEALEWYAALIHEHDAAPTRRQATLSFGSGQYAIYQGIRRGQVGMWMGGLSERGGLSWPVEWDMRWGMVPLPSDVGSATQAMIEGYALSAQTEHRDACWEWIAFLSQQVPYRLMPARRSLAESAAYGEQVGDEVAATARTSIEYAIMINDATYARFEGAMDAFRKALDQIVNGDVAPLEAMDQAQRAATSKTGP
jgi:ABC-type glycerol-3-phosphate transport system substrate-binding protein